MTKAAEAIVETQFVVKPPYFPWKTFNTGIAAMKVATVPHLLDGTARPKAMSGGGWRLFVSAAKFFGLVAENGTTTDSFADLVNAHGTEQWKAAVKEQLVPAYDSIVSEVPLANGTAGQLDSAFRAKSGAENQMLSKTVRFYLHVLTEAGIDYSSRFTMRRETSGGKTRKKKAAGDTKTNDVDPGKTRNGESEKEDKLRIPNGMIVFPIPIVGKTQGMIVVPKDISPEDCAIVKIMFDAVEAYANQNGKKS